MLKRKVLKTIWNVFYSIIGLSAFVIFVVLPFLQGKFNPLISQIAWYLSATLIIVHSTLLKEKTKQHSLITFISDRSWFLIVILFTSAFVINYYDTGFDWYWAIFILIAIGIPFTAINILSYNRKNLSLTNDQIKNSHINISKAIFFWWFIDLFFISSVKQWMTWVFIFGGLSMLIVFYNLAFSFLANKKRNKLFLLQDFILGIGITIYLIYIVPDQRLQTILLTVVSAVYGGMITLVGIAWTIKENHNTNRLNYLKGIKPLFYAVRYNNVNYTNKSTIRMGFVPEDKSRKGSFVILGAIRNSEKSELIINKLTIDDISLVPEFENVIEKSKVVEVSVLFERDLSTCKDAFLYVFDVEGNQFSYRISFIHENNEHEILKIKEVSSDE